VNRAEALDALLDLLRMGAEARRAVIRSLTAPSRRAILEEWWWQVHGGQEEPVATPTGVPWSVWAIVAGRGFGKTRAGAEWVWARAREDGNARIALVAATEGEAAAVMVEGESGLLAVARCDEEPRWIASRGLLIFPSAAEARIFSAERPDKLRGPQHHFAWCDELAKWPAGRAGGLPRPDGVSRADATWDNLALGLRLGTAPRTIVTTTPRAAPLLLRILALPGCARTDGRTDDNPHNAPDFPAAMRALYAGTRLALQELDGLILEDHEDALWTRELIEKSRLNPSPVQGEGRLAEGERGEGKQLPNNAPPSPISGEGRLAEGERGEGKPPAPNLRPYTRILIGLDPPASTGGDACGIVVCGKDESGTVHVLADLSARGLTPEAWSSRVAEAASQYGAAKIVAEKNQGGDMIASVLRAADADLPVKLVAATRSKAARAEPIALRFQTGRAKLAGHFPELETQLCALTWSGYEGPGSPDRADAMVWAMTELFEKERAAPMVRRL